MTEAVWLVPALPFLGFIVDLFAGRRLGRAAGWLATLSVAAAAVVAVGVGLDVLAHPAEERTTIVHLYDWIRVGAFSAAADLRVDQLSVLMILVVTIVGTLIHLYAIGYMEGDPRLGRFFAYLNLFVSFMLVLVLAENLLLLYVGWEGVGLCSYLLIGFWFDRPAAANAAKKAFVTTRIGDTFMLVGIALVFLRLGSLDFSVVLDPAIEAVQPSGVFTVIALLLFAGAIGKSAQVPLHVWLPDAMEGPTPVSALIHAATMVTAGVYLVVRTHLFFEISGVALVVVLVVGVVTALYAALSALGQDDIKRVLAYSTVSQLGFMFTAAGMRAYSVAMFMLAAHACYKALLFLSAGSVMHGTHELSDLKRMGGLRRRMPWTAGAAIAGALSLAGVIGLAGYVAKDEILAIASETGRTAVWVLGTLAALLSALYIGRWLFLTFFGDPRSEEAGRAHESPPVMLVPFLALAVGAVGLGVLMLDPETGLVPTFLEPVLGAVPHGDAGVEAAVLVVISQVVALGGLAVTWLVYASARVDWLALRLRLAPLPRFLGHGMYVDDLYARVLVAPAKAGSAILATVVDAGAVDGLVNAVGRLFQSLAGVGRRVQTGLVRTYALAFLLGALALLAYVGVRG
ncbi:MAG TPA: NADH-quinone oxidoreductase subunit L [Actinomycetota bacterium]|nr:NADH-quinone oxidoreductase subunit L [Actinomycetota bacterium]